MAYPRTPIAELKLKGSTNLKRALSYGPPKTKATAKRKELEEMFATVQERYQVALADVKKRGAVIWQDCWKGPKVIRVEVVNPNLKICQQSERQLVSLAKMLTTEIEAEPKEKSTEEQLADMREFLA